MLDSLLQSFMPIDIEQLRPDGFFKSFMAAKQKDILRIVNGSGWEKRMHCPICENNDKEAEFNFLGINIFRCKSCNHRYTEKVPVNPNEIYDSKEYREAIDKFELKQKEYRMRRFGIERANIVKSLFINTNKNVLDVGSGWGFFLKIIREEGFQCQGIELSRNMAEFSRKKFNLPVTSIPIEEYKPNKKFDIITLFGVIEHVKYPIDFLKHCKRLLADEGYILIFTPNFESVAVKVQGSSANMICPGQHIHHFTKDSMRKTSELLSLNIISYSTKGLDIGDIYSYLISHCREDTALFLLKYADLFQSMIDQAECGNHMRIVFRKF